MLSMVLIKAVGWLRLKRGTASTPVSVQLQLTELRI